MGAADLVADGRALAAETFFDVGRILAPATGKGTLDPDTLVHDAPEPTLVHEGPCRVRMPTVVEQETLFGDAEHSRTRFVSNWPHDIPLVRKGMVVQIVESLDPTFLADPDLRMEVVAIGGKSALMYRQLGMEVIER